MAGLRITYAFGIALAALVLVGPGSRPALATDMPVGMTCPYDGTQFTARMQASGTTVGTLLDFRPVGEVVAPWPLAVCPTNGFVFFKEKLTEAELAKLRPFVLSAEYQAMREETPYYRAAWLMERAGARHADVTWTLLQATWEAYRLPDRYPRYVEAVLARLPDDIAAASDMEKTKLRMIQGELLRRLGRFDAAAAAFRALSADLGTNTAAGRIAAFEVGLCERKDGTAHLTCEAMGANADGGDCQALTEALRQRQAQP
jgi:hypothetical protein